MKIVLIASFAAVLLLSVSGAQLPEYVRGTPVVSIRSRAGCSAANAVECSDCTTMRVCSSDSSVAGTIACSGLTPYCTNNRCSAVPDPISCSNNVLCPKANSFFPNPTNCQLFHYCDANKMLVQYQCPTNYIYNHQTIWCRLRSPTNVCSQVTCSGNLNRFVVYPGDPSLYVFCGSSSKNILYACESGDQFNSGIMDCEFACKEEGQFPYRQDCAKYNACYLTAANNFTKIVSTCPAGMLFNPVNKACDVNLKQCYVAPPPEVNPEVTPAPVPPLNP